MDPEVLGLESARQSQIHVAESTDLPLHCHTRLGGTETSSWGGSCVSVSKPSSAKTTQRNEPASAGRNKRILLFKPSCQDLLLSGSHLKCPPYALRSVWCLPGANAALMQGMLRVLNPVYTQSPRRNVSNASETSLPCLIQPYNAKVCVLKLRIKQPLFKKDYAT